MKLKKLLISLTSLSLVGGSTMLAQGCNTENKEKEKTLNEQIENLKKEKTKLEAKKTKLETEKEDLEKNNEKNKTAIEEKDKEIKDLKSKITENEKEIKNLENKINANEIKTAIEAIKGDDLTVTPTANTKEEAKTAVKAVIEKEIKDIKKEFEIKINEVEFTEATKENNGKFKFSVDIEKDKTKVITTDELTFNLKFKEVQPEVTSDQK